MKLYDFPRAPNPRRLRIYLAEKGIEIPTETVDLATREQLSEAYRSKNPLCTVPMLELDDGQCIVDSQVICRYLEELNPDPPLFGGTPLERARVNEWLQRIEFEGLQAVAETLRNKSPHFVDRGLSGPLDYPQIEALIERGRQRIMAFFDVLDVHLQERRFVATDEFTMADISALVVVDFAGWIKAEPGAGQRALTAWHGRVSARPSAGA